MNSLDKNKKSRAIARGLTTKLLSKIEVTLQQNVDENVISDLRELLEHLTIKSELLKNYDNDIEKLISKEDELENEIVTAQEYQEKIISLKCKIQDKIRKNTIKNESMNSEVQFKQNIKTKAQVKLPKLIINKYFGDPSNWLDFWNQYESAIHKNDSISCVDKFNYLKSLCGGLALNAITGLALTQENYFVAIDILKERFGRTDLTINTHMNKLLNLEGVKISSNVSALRKLYDDIEINIRSLETLHVTTGSYGNLLGPILLKLLPHDLALEFNRKQNMKTEFDVKEFLDFLKTEIQCRENVYFLNNKRDSVSVPQYSNKDKYVNTVKGYQNDSYKRGKAATTAFMASVKRDCLFCDSKDHESEKCLISIEERKIKVKKHGLCFKCLRPKHLAKNCWRRTVCNFCKQTSHNTLLCEKQNKNQTSEIYQNKTNVEGQNSDAISTTVSTCNTTELKPNTTIFLQTCTALVSSDSKSKMIRILLDGGSQRTFISRNLAKELNFPAVGKENLQIHSFGDERPLTGDYQCVKVRLQNSYDRKMKTTVDALVVNKITGANVVNIPNNWIKKKMKEMSLCYSDNNNLPIEMLIGADNYWAIVTGNMYRLSRRLVAFETLFGITLQGKTTSDSGSNSYVGVNKVLVVENKNILSDIKALWELDMLGIQQNENKHESENNILKDFKNGILYKDKRYETRLLWKENPGNLDNNYVTAEQRLKGLNKRFKQNVWLSQQYEEILNDQLNKNIIEECTFNMNDEKCYFMPHHPVIRNDKSTKVRIVYDASSKGKDKISLNDCLLNGPNLNPSILDVILKFREKKTAFTANIEKTFL